MDFKLAMVNVLVLATEDALALEKDLPRAWSICPQGEAVASIQAIRGFGARRRQCQRRGGVCRYLAAWCRRLTAWPVAAEDYALALEKD